MYKTKRAPIHRRGALQCALCARWVKSKIDPSHQNWDLDFFYWDFQELNPAIRCNLLLFKEKSKRISAPIGAMASVFRRRFPKQKTFSEEKKKKLSAFAPLRD
ncbi:hypothetical protein [Flavobacterium sp. KACC 22761]|uniref:hypothetical protein n=1 Tax=Flavobacterium sp. KACC 22761 TaxID=3092665 RepID=UPI002A7594A8|nr:hypothetical protein [Flavobacterium sp. KACC 22761]WPO78355.1 hypothetical protein SCB73_19030 [Flavobacterium sp. KACC 22761]WPO79657.1 hypothetical protein SCB73_04610 [Flavobacterium sp. KACC 22761]